MAITVSPNPVNLQWSNFRTVPNLPDEEAHVDINFNVPNRPFRRVDGQFTMAETFQIGVSPEAKKVQGASPMAREFSELRALGTAIRNCFNRHKDTLMPPI